MKYSIGMYVVGLHWTFQCHCVMIRRRLSVMYM